MAAILQLAQKQGGPLPDGGWQNMARRRFQRGTLRKRGKRSPVWELQWRQDYIKTDGRIGRRLATRIIGACADLTKRQAQKAAEEILRPLNLGKLRPESAMTVVEFWSRYFEPNVFPLLKPSTRRLYRDLFQLHLLPAFGCRRLSEIGTVDLQQFVLRKMDAGLGWQRAAHLRNLTSKLFATARKWALFAGENPALAVELPKKTYVRERRMLAPDQIPRLLSELAEPVRSLVQLALLTGLRIGELLALRWEDLDLAAGKLRVERNYCRGDFGTPKSKASRRALPLPLPTAHALAALRPIGAEPGALVFPNSRGAACNDCNLLRRHLKPAGRRIGAPWLSWHVLRRTHCTLLQRAGGSLRDAQAQMGHAKGSTTLDYYTLEMPDSQREAVENLARMMANDGELAKTGTGDNLQSSRIQ
jgi:integrase